MVNAILVVCTGNICRSPTGERLLRRAFPHKKIDSAGLAALTGQGAERHASAVAEQHGLSLAGHRAQQFTRELAKEYELILVMDRQQLQVISQMAPEVSGKTLLFGHWLGAVEIVDPYRQSPAVFESVYQLMSRATATWVPKLGGGV